VKKPEELCMNEIKGEFKMKIAVAGDDRINVAEHFGGSSLIIVATVEGGEVVKKKERTKLGHDEFAKGEHYPQTDEKGRHGFGPDAETRHEMMLDTLKDCEVLIVNRIGTGAYDYFTNAGIKVTATDVRNIDDAISLYIQGKLTHLESHVD
jgi:predicted Fe-Mo cluster-binding NifX family protein